MENLDLSHSATLAMSHSVVSDVSVLEMQWQGQKSW